MKKRLELYYHAMLLPGIILLIIFSIVPMGGLLMAFEKYVPIKGILGSKFVGLANFRTIFMFSDSRQVMLNTLVIAIAKILLNLAVPVAFALLLNECRVRWFKRSMQTIVYLPNFLSWVIVASMFVNIFSTTGIVNSVLKAFGQQEPIIFMASNFWFQPIIIFSDTWKSFGFSAIVYIAAINNIDLNLYEASDIDGANRWQKMRYITFPGILTMIVLMATLSLGNILNAGFDQVFNMYNPSVYHSGDILDTYVYGLAFGRAGSTTLSRFDLATAVGLFKSVISFILIIIAYKFAYKFANYSVF